MSELVTEAQQPVPWGELPKAALAIVFKSLSTSQQPGHRLFVGLVCSSWEAAATEAVESVVLDGSNVSSLQAWISHHGNSVKQLHLTAPFLLLTSLPCSRLTSLLLQGWLTSSSAALLPRMLAGLPELQQLSLLQHEDTTPVTTRTRKSGHLWPSDLLQQAPQITYLQLSGGLSAAALQHISSLTALQHLQLLLPSMSESAWLLGLQHLHGLTFLQLSGLSCSFGLSTVPVFSSLTGLQHLHLAWHFFHGCSMQPVLLAGLTQLQHLYLEAVAFHSSTATSTDTDHAAAEDAGTSTGAEQYLAQHTAPAEEETGAELLALLPQLQQLTHLGLVDTRGLFSCPAAAFSALTSSSSLQELVLHGVQHSTGDVWQHVFPPKVQLTRLQKICISRVRPHLDSAQLAAVVRCCPSVQDLNITDALAPAVSVVPLLQLGNTLTKLSFTMHDPHAAAVVQLTGLQDLSVVSHMSLEALRSLTALQRLTSFGLDLRKWELRLEHALEPTAGGAWLWGAGVQDHQERGACCAVLCCVAPIWDTDSLQLQLGQGQQPDHSAIPTCCTDLQPRSCNPQNCADMQFLGHALQAPGGYPPDVWSQLLAALQPEAASNTSRDDAPV